MVSCARRGRTIRMCSLDARSGRPIQATLLEEIHASVEGPSVKGLFDARNRGSTRPHSLRETWRLAQERERVRASLEGAFISGERRSHGPLLPERAPSEGPRSTGAVGPTRAPFTLEETSKLGGTIYMCGTLASVKVAEQDHRSFCRMVQNGPISSVRGENGDILDCFGASAPPAPIVSGPRRS